MPWQRILPRLRPVNQAGRMSVNQIGIGAKRIASLKSSVNPSRLSLWPVRAKIDVVSERSIF